MKGLSLPWSLLPGHHPIMPELLLQSAVVHVASPLLFFGVKPCWVLTCSFRQRWFESEVENIKATLNVAQKQNKQHLSCSLEHFLK